MSIKIDGVVFVTTAETCKLLGIHHAYLFECIYRNHFAGIISIDDSAAMIEYMASVNIDSTPFILPQKKYNKFLIPISEVIAKKITLDAKREKNYIPVKSGVNGSKEIEKKIAPEKKLLRIPDLSKIMGISEQTVRRWIKTDKISSFVKPMKIGRIIFFEREKIQEFLRKGNPVDCTVEAKENV